MWMKIKKFQKKYEDVWEGVKKEIETINSGEIKFESNDNLPLKKTYKTTLIDNNFKSGFREDAKFYPQLF